MIEDLALYQKTYDLYIYTHKFLKKFPKSERFLISSQMQNALLMVLKYIVKANLQKDRTQRLSYQDEIEAWLYIYITSLRLSHDLRMLPPKKYAHASLLAEELMKMLYGWKKS